MANHDFVCLLGALAPLSTSSAVIPTLNTAVTTPSLILASASVHFKLHRSLPNLLKIFSPLSQHPLHQPPPPLLLLFILIINLSTVLPHSATIHLPPVLLLQLLLTQQIIWVLFLVQQCFQKQVGKVSFPRCSDRPRLVTVTYKSQAFALSILPSFTLPLIFFFSGPLSCLRLGIVGLKMTPLPASLTMMQTQYTAILEADENPTPLLPKLPSLDMISMKFTLEESPAISDHIDPSLV